MNESDDVSDGYLLQFGQSWRNRTKKVLVVRLSHANKCMAGVMKDKEEMETRR